MSYSIDVYRKVVEPETNYFRYLTYVSMFPQLIAGPIVRYETINKELHQRHISFNDVFISNSPLITKVTDFLSSPFLYKKSPF